VSQSRTQGNGHECNRRFEGKAKDLRRYGPERCSLMGRLISIRGLVGKCGSQLTRLIDIHSDQNQQLRKKDVAELVRS
jgi:hypothetical protein